MEQFLIKCFVCDMSYNLSGKIFDVYLRIYKLIYNKFAKPKLHFLCFFSGIFVDKLHLQKETTELKKIGIIETEGGRL